jgi:hypothetical protein
MRLRRSVRTAANASLAGLGAYVLGAYFIVPEIWILQYPHRASQLGGMVTMTESDIPGDPINVGLVGSKDQVIRAFARARWDPADAITLRSSIDIGLSVVLDRPYPDAPVSTLIYEGRRQDLAFEKLVGNSADRRHHVRFWLTDKTGEDGRPLWLGSATFDRGIGFNHNTGRITHGIDPNVDAERDLVIRELSATGQIVSTYESAGVGATDAGRNGGGDPYFTDGRAKIAVLRQYWPCRYLGK